MRRLTTRLFAIAALVAACSASATGASPGDGRPPAPGAATARTATAAASGLASTSARPSRSLGSRATATVPKPEAATALALPATGANSYEHIFLVVFENKPYSRIVGQSTAPTFNRLIRQGALATAYTAIRHPSLPNYLAMVGGSTFRITSDCSPSTCPVRATNLGSLLTAKGRTWKGYMESMPASCRTTSSGSYAVKHDPFVYFDNIRTTSLCRRVVPYPQLATDLRSNTTTPRFAFVTPNLCDDMHDCSVATGDRWLSTFASLVTRSPAWTTHRSLLIVTFDEDDGSAANRVVTFALGSPVRRTVRAGARSSVHYNHYDLLRTLEYYLGVPTLGRLDATHRVMTGIVPS